MTTYQPQNIIIAEDIRMEVNNKITLVGVAPSNVVISKSKNSKHAIHSLAIYCEILNGDEISSAHISITAPNEEILVEGNIPIPEGDKSHMVLAGRFVNMKFKESGLYKISIAIEDNVISKDIEILIREEK
ncbi:hypothetical protein [Ectopseudomonas hydrolytica]|uniref:hypothetical protein n=1 Tax=Ectopseudomonas hydrolytica TaxID=2493633 RepID=UPI00376EEFF6